jgi:hypothetical protein
VNAAAADVSTRTANVNSIRLRNRNFRALTAAAVFDS